MQRYLFRVPFVEALSGASFSFGCLRVQCLRLGYVVQLPVSRLCMQFLCLFLVVERIVPVPLPRTHANNHRARDHASLPFQRAC